MNKALVTVKPRITSSNKNISNTSPFSYRVVCERCHKTVFFLGNDNVKPIYVLCDQCALSN